MTHMVSNRPYRVGLALSGGGIRGLCHAGVLKAMEEYSIKPDIISGVSSGAVVGALYADGYSPDEIGALFEDVRFRKMTHIHLHSGGFFSIEAFRDFMSKTLRSHTFEALRIPLRVLTTNLDTGQSVVFDSGSLIDPLVASCSIPVLFSPQIIEGVRYVDGGVCKNFPVSTIRSECDRVLGVNASPLIANEYKPTIVNVALRAYHFMSKANILYDKELCDLLIEPVDLGNYETFEAEKGREIFALGYRTAKQILENAAPSLWQI